MTPGGLPGSEVLKVALEAVFGVEVGLPEEVEVEAELVIIKVKVSGRLTGSGRDPVLAAVSQRFTFPSAAPQPPAQLAAPACPVFQPTPSSWPYSGSGSSSSSSSSSSSVAKLLLGTFSAHSARELQADPRRPRWSVF